MKGDKRIEIHKRSAEEMEAYRDGFHACYDLYLYLSQNGKKGDGYTTLFRRGRFNFTKYVR